MKKSEIKRLNLKKYLEILNKKGFLPVPQTKCWYHYKDGDFNFYPTTGTYYNDATYKKGKIEDLPDKKDLIDDKNITHREENTQNIQKNIKKIPFGKNYDVLPPKKYRYYNLDIRYLPDWVLEPNRQKYIQTLIKTPQD